MMAGWSTDGLASSKENNLCQIAWVIVNIILSWILWTTHASCTHTSPPLHNLRALTHMPTSQSSFLCNHQYCLSFVPLLCHMPNERSYVPSLICAHPSILQAWPLLHVFCTSSFLSVLCAPFIVAPFAYTFCTMNTLVGSMKLFSREIWKAVVGVMILYVVCLLERCPSILMAEWDVYGMSTLYVVGCRLRSKYAVPPFQVVGMRCVGTIFIQVDNKVTRSKIKVGHEFIYFIFTTKRLFSLLLQ